ncbi:hypothetical protein AGMMS49938_12480 [Fibrobacterales bacterium]|nr:hypothetical protein AGMMS49938_12480 [Fibrobacterales bacterium]
MSALQITAAQTAAQATAPRLPNAATDDAKKWKAAQEFEAMFVHQMMKSMRKTVPQDEEMSSGRRIFTEMLDEQISNSASKNGSFGIAKMVYKELAGENATPPSAFGAYSTTASANSAYGAPRASEKQIENWISEAADTLGVDKNLIRAVIRQESGGNSLARSNKGAKGLMQLMDSTAKEMGVVNSFSGRQNVMGGTRYLKQLLAQFGGDEQKALAAYNAGASTVEQYGGIPPYQETQEYVKRVLEYKEEYEK